MQSKYVTKETVWVAIRTRQQCFQEKTFLFAENGVSYNTFCNTIVCIIGPFYILVLFMKW